MSLRALAGRADVTASLLSQIETGRVNPSVETLFVLSSALDVPVPYFFEGEASQASPSSAAGGIVVRRPQRARLDLEHGVVWESLLPVEQAGLELLEIHYPPGAASSARLQRHGGRDHGIVTHGSLTIRLAFSEFVLAVGDSIAFDATTPHQLRNDGEKEAVAIWLVIERHAPA